MKNPCLTMLILLAGCVTGGCTLFCEEASYGDLKQPRVEFRQFQEGTALHVAGIVNPSVGNAVEMIRQLKTDKTIHIEVLVSPFERDNTGTAFQTDVFLDGIDYITFGKDRTLLWRRNPEKKSDLPSKAKPVFEREE